MSLLDAEGHFINDRITVRRRDEIIEVDSRTRSTTSTSVPAS